MKKLLNILLLITITLPAISQTDRIDSLLNDLVYNDSDPLLMPEKPVKFSFLSTGLYYNSNTFYAGREVSSDKPYNMSGYLFFYNTAGFYLGASGNWIDQLNPGYNTTSLSIGYSRAIDKNKHFTLRSSYSHYLFNIPDSLAEYYPYKNNINLGLSFRKSWIGARVSSNFLFGDNEKFNLSTAVYSRFNLAKIGKSNKIYMAPEISTFFSSEMVATNKAGTIFKETFGLLNTQLYFPVGITIGNFDLELSYSINFPTTQDVNITYPVKSYFGFSLGYLLPIVRK